MPAAAPENVSPSDLRTLLESLEAAGVPLGLEPGWRAAAGELALRVSAAEPLEVAAQSSALDATPNYRRFVRLVAAGVPPVEVLERFHTEASLQETTGRRLARGFAYPAVVAAVAAAGLLLIGWTVLPLVETSYADLRKPPGASLQWMLAVRDSAPVWLVLGPVGIGLIFWLLGKTKPLRLTRRSAALGPTALLRYAGACHDEAALLGLGERTAGVEAPSDAGRDPDPPLLAWARGAGAPASDFRAIGRAYDHLARNGSQAYAAWVPLAATLLIGGGATLVYALALFAPLAELLWTLAF